MKIKQSMHVFELLTHLQFFILTFCQLSIKFFVFSFFHKDIMKKKNNSSNHTRHFTGKNDNILYLYHDFGCSNHENNGHVYIL